MAKRMIVKVEDIEFDTDYVTVPAMLGEIPVQMVAATKTHALVWLPGSNDAQVVLVERLHR